MPKLSFNIYNFFHVDSFVVVNLAIHSLSMMPLSLSTDQRLYFCLCGTDGKSLLSELSARKHFLVGFRKKNVWDRIKNLRLTSPMHLCGSHDLKCTAHFIILNIPNC